MDLVAINTMHHKQLPNLFVVNTPHQLLNAIEAVHSLELANNHLLVMKPTNTDQDRFTPMIDVKDWETVRFMAPYLDVGSWAEKNLHPVAYRWYCRYLHYRRMAKLARITREFKKVERLFLGHYFAEEKPFMRHLSNTIRHDQLWLLDDGTDTIEINKRRHALSSLENQGAEAVQKNSKQTSLKAVWLGRYWDWQLEDPSCVVFFTVYKLDVAGGDRLVKNDYSHLRSLSPGRAVEMRDTVIFIGQCIADGYFEAETLFALLHEAGRYFAGKKVLYVPHPRESFEWISRVKDDLQWELWIPSSVIEQDLVIRGFKPAAVAGIVSSALITLAQLMEPDVEIVCFHVAPEHWLGWGEYAVGVYEYLDTKMRDRVSVVPLSLSVNTITARGKS